jgi:hypothetical protein
MHHDNLTTTITVHARDPKYPDDEVHVDTSATPQFRARLRAVVEKNEALRLKFIEKHSNPRNPWVRKLSEICNKQKE